MVNLTRRQISSQHQAVAKMIKKILNTNPYYTVYIISMKLTINIDLNMIKIIKYNLL